MLRPAEVARNEDSATVFALELCVYPHGQLPAVSGNEQVFAHAFFRESQRPVIISAQNTLDPYRCLLFEDGQVYEVDEWPEDEQTAAITVTPENKTLIPLL